MSSLIDLRPGLRSHLLSDSAISSLVGGSRIYPVMAPQGLLATHIVYHYISNQGDRHMQGPSGLSRPRIQIDCWAQAIDQAITLGLEVKERLDGFRGMWIWGSNSPQKNVQVQGVFFDSERDDFDNDVKLFLVSHDYIVWFEEL